MPSQRRPAPEPDQSTPGPRQFPCPGGCGGKRDEGRVFCARCYRQLPTDLQRLLWKMAGTKAFAANLQDAKAYLAARRG